MFKQYRPIEHGEQIVIGGDCSQGGSDFNYCQFLSKTKLDIPLVYKSRGTASEMTNAIYPVLERIFKTTGIKPLVGFERNMGGASEMQRLAAMNHSGTYDLFTMQKIGFELSSQEQDTNRYGWDTNVATRPVMIGELKNAIDAKLIAIYDEDTVNQLKVFVVNKHGKPEATRGKHDDGVISLAIAYQLHLRQIPSVHDGVDKILYGDNYERINIGLSQKWTI